MRARLLSDGRCLRVIDGDTILADITCPCCKVQSQQRVRLARIDAPELRGPERGNAIMARDRLKTACQGRPIAIAVQRAWPDRYGRVIAEVLVDGVNMSDMLLASGLVRHYDTRLDPCQTEPRTLIL